MCHAEACVKPLVDGLLNMSDKPDGVVIPYSVSWKLDTMWRKCASSLEKEKTRKAGAPAAANSAAVPSAQAAGNSATVPSPTENTVSAVSESAANGGMLADSIAVAETGGQGEANDKESDKRAMLSDLVYDALETSSSHNCSFRPPSPSLGPHDACASPPFDVRSL